MTPRDHLIGTATVGVSQRYVFDSLAQEQSSARRVSARSNASNAWNQNWNSSIPGYQNNNNKTNSNRVRAVRRAKATLND
jgi:hypothetical protein